MSRLLAPLLPALLAGCIASASAQDGGHDVLTLTSGERLVGELVDVRDGRYWVLLTDGRLVSADFRTVALVEMAGRRLEPVAREDLPVPLWDEPPEETYRPIGTGFDFGLTQGGRVRFRINTPAVAHVDVKAGLGLVYASGIGFGFITGGEVAFFGKSPVHLTLSANAGPALIYGSFYPFVGLGAGFQFDPVGPFEVHLGLNAGTTFSYFAATPDLALSWVW